MTISYTYENNEGKLEISNAKIKDVLEKIGINSETVIVSVNGEIVPDSEKVKDGDKLEIMKIVSGG